MLTYILLLAGVLVGLVCGSVYESNSPRNNTSSFSSAPADSSSTYGFSDNLYSFGPSSSSSPVSSFAFQASVIPYDIYSSGMVPVYGAGSDALVADDVSSSQPSSLVADNIFTSAPLSNRGITIFREDYPHFGNLLIPFSTDHIGNGPETGPLPIIQAPPLTLPWHEEALITLSHSPVSKPRVISSKCICKKTVIKPQVYHRTITVPKVEHYLVRTVNAVIEDVAFKSKPMTSCKCKCKCRACANRNKATKIKRSTSPIYTSRLMSPGIRVL